jgi:hypothetical protein
VTHESPAYPIHDHIIIGHEGFVSILEQQWL